MTHYARRSVAVALVAGLILWLSDASSARQENAPPLRVEKVKYAELGKLVRAQKGKVVVVDFWADFCIPCKREFPHLVALYNKYKKADFVAVSVALDKPDDAKAHANILAFLARQKAEGLTNLQIDEGQEFWLQKLGIEGPPCVYVFNREGRIARKWVDNVDYEEIEKTVAELLKK